MPIHSGGWVPFSTTPLDLIFVAVKKPVKRYGLVVVYLVDLLNPQGTSKYK